MQTCKHEINLAVRQDFKHDGRKAFNLSLWRSGKQDCLQSVRLAILLASKPDFFLAFMPESLQVICLSIWHEFSHAFFTVKKTPKLRLGKTSEQQNCFPVIQQTDCRRRHQSGSFHREKREAPHEQSQAQGQITMGFSRKCK